MRRLVGLERCSLHRSHLPDLQRGKEALADYDAMTTAVNVAALQLLPENARLLGRLEAAAYIASTLAPQPLSGDFMREAQPLIGATLELSDRVLRGAGLVRNTPPAGHPGDDVTVPPGARLHQLQQAVTFDADELALTILEPLVQAQGSTPLAEDDGSGHVTLARPILPKGDRCRGRAGRRVSRGRAARRR